MSNVPVPGTTYGAAGTSIRPHEELGPVTEALTWEHRNVGKHAVIYGPVGTPPCCSACGNLDWRMAGGYGACPSKQERRLVGPWEPVPSEGEAR